MSEAHLTRRAAIAAVLMAAAAAGGQAMVPTKRMALLRGPFKLDDLVPVQFRQLARRHPHGRRHRRPADGGDAEQALQSDSDRVYVDDAGHSVMLSIAYGADQADDDVQLHYPEVCYPAQGFRIKATASARLPAARATSRLGAWRPQFGDSRFEPVTYWTIIGDQQSLGGWIARSQRSATACMARSSTACCFASPR